MAGKKPRKPAAPGAPSKERKAATQPPVVDSPAIVIPVLPGFASTAESNFFDTSRPGRAVVRAEDLLALRIELHNLVIDPGSPPRLRKSGSGAATLILHFPPQTITEETFIETATLDEEKLTGPPVRARIAGESRLAFTVPDGFDVPYTLEGVLTACEVLAPNVAANAQPGPVFTPILRADLFPGNVRTLSATQRAALTSRAVRSLRMAAMRQGATAFQVRRATTDGVTNDIGLNPAIDLDITVPTTQPRPAAPGPQHTAIELPWRLILSPHSGERWRHAKMPVVAPLTQRTELWHSRLVVPQTDGSLIEPPRPDPMRTVRAIWALAGEGSSGTPMSGNFPSGEDVKSWADDDSPFDMSMGDEQRFQIVHLSSNFSRRGYTPLPIDTKLLMLSSLGAWLDSRGVWPNGPDDLPLEEWVHRGTMGRDHYVRIVEKGFLWPFGHRAVLITVSERKFHNGAIGRDGKPVVEFKAGNVAYLRKRQFIVIRERERTFTETNLSKGSGESKVKFQFQMPFPRLRILTEVTPNLDPPIGDIAIQGDQIFWPFVNAQPFRFQCVATDLDDRSVSFDLPMIFMKSSVLGEIAADEATAEKLRNAWNAHKARRTAPMKQQSVALADSPKAGDTTVQVDEMEFDAEIDPNNPSLRQYTQGLQRPPFYPKVVQAKVRIPALAQLTGSTQTNTIRWNKHYLKHGYENNQGQVFVDVLNEPGMAKLDFSTQGDRSGGFVQPNLKPNAISRLTGPVAGDVQKFISGSIDAKDAFPTTLSDLPLPLLFGCIPLGDVIQALTDLGDKPEQAPKFASETGTQLESFINGLIRLFDLASKLADQPGRIAESAIDAVQSTLDDLKQQIQAYTADLVTDAKSQIQQLETALKVVKVEVHQLVDTSIDAVPALPNLPGAIVAAQSAATNLRNTANAQVGGVSLPAGLRQSMLQVAGVIDTLLGDLGTVLTLVVEGKAVFAALEAIVGQQELIGGLLEDPGALKTKIEALQAALGPPAGPGLRKTLGGFRLLDGAPRQIVLDAIDAVVQVLDGAGDLLKLLEMLTGDELTVRFDWNPRIANWSIDGPNPPPDEAALFRANDKHGFLVAVEAKVKKNGQSAPKISVVCSLKSFDLVLIAPASFIEINFEKIEFRVDSAAKMDVDVLLNDIKFVGPLSFVETLRDLIPLDGFSDPPFLDITSKGIDAGFSIALPAISLGMFNLSNLSLGAGFTVPFIGQPLSVRFNFCTREQPFSLTYSAIGGGGFFGITLDPSGIQILEASFEFGASLSIDLGVASGNVHVMAGVYFRMEKKECSLTGYFRLGGQVSVLGIINASIELYLSLRYEFESGKCVGRAQLTIEVEVVMFSKSVTITCERKFAGSNGDPTFRDLMGLQPELSLADELVRIDSNTNYAWREYAEAFG